MAVEKTPKTPTVDPRPWYTGHNGATNMTRAEMAQRARGILESPDYRASLERRIKNDTLPPAVETMLYAYAYGKPAETLNINAGSPLDALQNCTTEELQQIAQESLRELEEVRRTEESIPAEYRRSA